VTNPARGKDVDNVAVTARNVLLLAIGVVAISFSSILIRETDAPFLAIALYRNAMAAAVVLPLAVARHGEELRSLRAHGWGLAALAGALLAIHFALWIPSLSYTTVAASTVLVTTHPVWVALIGRALGERPGKRAWIGIALSLAGAILISGGDLAVSGRAAFGDLLALLGAVTASGYYLSGRSLRRSVSLLPYVAVVYTTCALVLAGTMLVTGTAFSGFGRDAWFMFALMALGPQILGHTVFNYLLRDVETVVVSIAITGEPVGAALLALAFFGEVPPWAAIAGGALVLGGIYVTVSARRRSAAAIPIG
jgi:drug/metabolite transporter (DMT)-like permease